MSSLPASILALGESHSQLLDRLTTWSAINSGSGHIKGLEKMAAVLESALLELTPHVERIPLDREGRIALRATLRPEVSRRILCSGHYDTVFHAQHPFQSPQFISDDRLNGPGVADMKGGIVVMLAALAAFEQTPDASQLGWTILLTPDEETGSEVSQPVIQAAAPDHHLALVFEPARESGNIVQSRSATGVLSATMQGRAAHAGRDATAGRNAIVALSQFCLALDRLPASIPNLLVNVGRFTGGGTVNIVPDHATAAINTRASTVEAMNAFNDAITSLVTETNSREGYDLKVTGGFNRDPLVVTPAREALFLQYQACARDLNLPKFDWQAVAGGSDGNLLHSAGLPVLDGLGPIGGGLHSDSEYIETSSLTQRTQLAALFLHRLATKEFTL